ncbi:acyl-CoA synthetase family protein [Marimonas lutisalis]|uniref:hypothetical protein n=1 Tax=Marimonas lutisalis TaxID=2545756 RepID=UPI0010F44108|nr:hypothetical protein [Marimonas lutisalis]
MKPQEMSRDRLEHTASQFEAALHRLRKAIGLIGFCLPFLLLIGVWFFGIPMQESISEFFFTGLRDVFVLALSGVGVFLVAYHGHDPEEDEILSDWLVSTIAGATALGVALIPTLCAADCYRPPALADRLIGSDMAQSTLHFGSAGIFLSSLAVMSIWLFTRTDDPSPPPDKLRRNALYRVCGWVIFAMVAALLVFKMLLRDIGQAWDAAWHFTFWAESISVWAFGLSWLVKGEALRGRPTVFLYGVNNSPDINPR